MLLYESQILEQDENICQNRIFHLQCLTPTLSNLSERCQNSAFKCIAKMLYSGMLLYESQILGQDGNICQNQILYPRCLTPTQSNLGERCQNSAFKCIAKMLYSGMLLYESQILGQDGTLAQIKHSILFQYFSIFYNTEQVLAQIHRKDSE